MSVLRDEMDALTRERMGHFCPGFPRSPDTEGINI
jgi:hypothetical protein